MKIRLDYTYGGFVPPSPQLHICLYLSPLGDLTFGVARSEYNMEEEKWQWNAELGQAFGNAPPLAYLTVAGSVEDVLKQLERDGYVVMGMEKNTMFEPSGGLG
jgi:hypothetical protein